jgi:hypothetical protein
MKAQNAVLSLLCYLLLLFCALTLTALAWTRFANGVLYRCSDPLLDLWPPFIHPGSDDSYLAPKAFVLLIWSCFVAAAFLLPALVIWSVKRFTGDDDNALG